MTAQRLNLRKTYSLTINGTAPSGLTNPEGLLLDGAGTGQPGSNYVTSLTRSNLAGSASQRPIAAVVKARARSLVARVKSTLHKHAEEHCRRRSGVAPTRPRKVARAARLVSMNARSKHRAHRGNLKVAP